MLMPVMLSRCGRWVVCIALVCGPAVGCKAEALDKKPVHTTATAITSQQAVTPPRAEAPSTTDGALQLAGDLRPEAAADLAFKISGQLLSVKVQRGQRVRKGQLLAALADTEVRAQLAQAEAAVAQARAQLALAQDNETRAAALVAANAAPGSQAVAVRLQAETAQAALLQAQAARDLMAAALSNHQLKAPFDGEIVRVPDGVGQIVAPGTPLFRLEALDRLLLRTTVSEADIDRIHVGDEVLIEASAGRWVSGKVRLVLRSLEPASRRAPIEVTIPNQDRALIAGSYVRATHKAR
jgi:RND family efflux transporter MFP subunit